MFFCSILFTIKDLTGSFDENVALDERRKEENNYDNKRIKNW